MTKTVADILTTYAVAGDEPTGLLQETLEQADLQIAWLRNSQWGEFREAAIDKLETLKGDITKTLNQRQGIGLDGMTQLNP